MQTPETLASGRYVPSRRAALALVAVAVVAAAVFGLRVAAALASESAQIISEGARPAPADPATGGPASSGTAGAPSLGARASPGASRPAEVVVHVVGAVNSPGLVHVPAGARVSDAVTAAGGATGEADLGAVNLARVVVDGEQIRVPKPGEIVAAPGIGSAGGGSGASGAGGSTLVSLNTADLSALDSLPGVGPVLAQRIIDWRTAQGGFTSVDELGEVAGIGDKLLTQLRPLVTL